MINIELIKKGISQNGFQAGDIAVLKVTFGNEYIGRDVIPTFASLPDGCVGSLLSSDIVDYKGERYKKSVKIAEGSVFWGYIELPDTLAVGVHTCSLGVEGREITDFELETVKKYRDRSNLEDAQSLARIKWLQSDLMQAEDIIPEPFEPVRDLGNGHYAILGRELTVDELGLPIRIVSCFNSRCELTDKLTDILSAPMVLSIGTSSENYTLNSTSALDYDGMYALTLELTAQSDIKITDISLTVPMENTPYFMGLGLPGGKMPEHHEFKWDSSKNQDGFWAGDVKGGLKMRFRDREYTKPNVNIYYAYKPLALPESWANGGKGAITVDNGMIHISTGELSLKKGEQRNFGIDMWVTPFKPIDLNTHFSERYYHTRHCVSPEHWLEQIEKHRPNIINLHHGGDLNPYLNYPFCETDALGDFTEKAHELGCRVKIYNTVRELSTKAVEFPILRSLGYEIIEQQTQKINGLVFWQDKAREAIEREVGEDVIPAWQEEIPSGKYAGQIDSTVLTSGRSRLCNYYIEGLNYLRSKTGIDGVYIDDTAFDRVTMKRLAKLFSADSDRIDMHSWNHADARAGRTSSAYLYMELMPYLSRLWLGESFNADKASPQYWLIEMSGIPYGLMSEMLAREGNFYRGLQFGQTTRLGWNKAPDENRSPLNVWQLFDEFDIRNSRMLGWWDEECPIATDNPDVLVTCYENGDKMLLAIANWTDREQSARLVKKSGELRISRIHIPKIRGEQIENEIDFTDEITIAPTKGIVMIVQVEL